MMPVSAKFTGYTGTWEPSIVAFQPGYTSGSPQSRRVRWNPLEADTHSLLYQVLQYSFWQPVESLPREHQQARLRRLPIVPDRTLVLQGGLIQGSCPV